MLARQFDDRFRVDEPEAEFLERLEDWAGGGDGCVDAARTEGFGCFCDVVDMGVAAGAADVFSATGALAVEAELTDAPRLACISTGIHSRFSW